jgi:hypothetical protein
MDTYYRTVENPNTNNTNCGESTYPMGSNVLLRQFIPDQSVPDWRTFNVGSADRVL